jgi:nucleoid-associated protein YejK
MQTSKAIIHFLEKESGENEAFPDFSENLIQVNEDLNLLIERLNKAFNKNGQVVKTEFRNDEYYPFQQRFRNYWDANRSIETFYEFTWRALNSLSRIIQGSTLAKGGYFIFAEYRTNNKDYLGVYLVRENEEFFFNKEGGYFVVNRDDIPDTSNLAMACRIDLTRFYNNEERYHQFTRHKQQNISDYFINWIEADLADKSKDDTRTLINIINNVELPEDPVTEEQYEEEKFRRNLFDYINSVGRVVKMDELGENFWGDPDYLLNYAQEHEIEIDQEFQADNNILKTLKKYEAKRGNLKISFTKSDYDKGVVYKGDGDQIVIDSEQIRQQIDQYFPEG